MNFPMQDNAIRQDRRSDVHRISLAFSVASLLCLSLSFSPAQQKTLPYKNPRLSVDVRVRDLLSRMTLEEKFWQLFMVGGDLEEGKEKYRHGIFGLQTDTQGSSDKVSEQLLRYGASGTARSAAEKINTTQRFFINDTRLGIPIIPFDEALHGLVRGGATAFPASIALAATWNPGLMSQVAHAIATETRTRGIRQILSPVVNVATDVRWGRVEETYGEDPYLSSVMGVNFVREFEKLGVITTPKHFVANHGDGGRDSYPAHWNERLLEEVYLPPFKACFQSGGSRSVMTSYNSLDGRPCTANEWLLQKKLTKEWGFKGFVISDAGAVGGMNRSPSYLEGLRRIRETGDRERTRCPSANERGSLPPLLQEGAGDHVLRSQGNRQGCDTSTSREIRARSF